MTSSRSMRVAGLTLTISVAGCLIGMAWFFPAIQNANAAMADRDSDCANLAQLSSFPIAHTEITAAKFVPAGPGARGVSLPDHCLVQGIINSRTGTDGFHYGIRFEVRLPLKDNWNGRFELQGGGGTEGSLPAAIGPSSAGPKLGDGWAIATQDGGHEDHELPSVWQFTHDKQALVDFSYNALDVTTQTAKFIIRSYYGADIRHSYFAGCSQGGRQGLMLATRFPTYFNGIVAAEGDYNAQIHQMFYVNTMKEIRKISPLDAQGNPQYSRSFPANDRELFTKALLAACDGLDGTKDGVVDNVQACNATFDPETFKFPDTGQALLCSGPKTDQCLSSAQIQAIKNIHRGPRDAKGRPIAVPIANQEITGLPYDGAIMVTLGERAIGSETAPPQMVGPNGLAQYLNHLLLKSPEPDAEFDLTKFNFDTDMPKLLNDGGPYQNFAPSPLDASKFAARGGKLIMYYGQSTSANPYYMGLFNYRHLSKDPHAFARLFLVPNMGHCQGGPSTDQFDALGALVDWVEKDKPVDKISAMGNRFVSPPTTRHRPLCAFPTFAKFTAGAGGDLANENNYICSSS